MTPFSIAILQLTLPNADNRDTIEQEVGTVLARFPWVQMVLLPELASFGPSLAHAEAMPSRILFSCAFSICSAAINLRSTKRANEVRVFPTEMASRADMEV